MVVGMGTLNVPAAMWQHTMNPSTGTISGSVSSTVRSKN
ncbi:hypothetical protein D8I24_3980 (plasmid) [Cupriavidus necator H850]|nr:hypothetical protein D8I24_3980 [Cupriavidus necator H850]